MEIPVKEIKVHFIAFIHSIENLFEKGKIFVPLPLMVMSSVATLLQEIHTFLRDVDYTKWDIIVPVKKRIGAINDQYPFNITFSGEIMRFVLAVALLVTFVAYSSAGKQLKHFSNN